MFLSFVLLHFSCSVTYHHRIYLWLVTIFFIESVLCCLDERIGQILADKVDGASAESASHDAGACLAAFLGNVIEEGQFLAADCIVL